MAIRDKRRRNILLPLQDREAVSATATGDETIKKPGWVVGSMIGHKRLLRLRGTATQAVWPTRQTRGAVNTGLKVY